MAITKRSESRSFNTPFRNDETGRDVLIAHCTYNERLVSVNFEFIDSEFCANNIAETEAAMALFLADVNAKLNASGLPSIRTNDAVTE